VDRCRHPDPGHCGVDLTHRVAECGAGRKIERDRGGDGEALVIDRERDVAGPEVGDGTERYHGFGVGAHGRAGRGRAVAGIGGACQ
jgi:hypothetical protein